MSIRLASSSKLHLRNGGVSLISLFAGIAATSIGITDYAANRIFQRESFTSGKTLPVQITYTGTPTYLQARCVDYDTGVAVVDWTTVATNPAASPATGLLTIPKTPRLKRYRLQVRCGVNTALTASATNWFAVGMIVALIGQSNMVHLSDAVTQTYPLADWRNRRYTQSTGLWTPPGNYDLTDAHAPGTLFATYGATYTGAAGGDGIIAFTNKLSQLLDIHVGTLEYAISGTAIASWQPGTGNAYNLFSAALTGAGNDCEAAIWYQGEDNANAGTSAASWQASAQNILNGIKTQTGRNSSNFKWGVVTLASMTTYAAEGNAGIIRKAQLDLAASNSESFLAGTPTDAPLNSGDTVHITPAAEATQGNRYAHTLSSAILGLDRQGPRITTASHSGAVVTVNISGGVGTLKDGNGSTGASLLGFRVYDNAVLATISSTVISGNTVVITLASAPSGPVTLDYAMANAPYGVTPALASVLYDSDTIVGETLGMPLQPKALISVA